MQNQIEKLKPQNVVKILFLVPPKVQLLDLSGPIHVFYEAREYDYPIELYYASIYNGQEDMSSCAGLTFNDLISYDDLELSSNDFIFVPGVNFELLSDLNFSANCKDFFKWLNVQNDNKVNICSICTGAFLLAQAGILNNRKCTTHWNRVNDFKLWYPEVTLLENRLFIKDDHIYTSAGVSAGIDLALHIVESLYGIKLTVDVAKQMVVYFRRGSEDAQISAFLAHRNHINNRIHEAQDFIINHLEDASSNVNVAERVNMSVRNLTRLFKKHTGITIGDYRKKIRIERALNLLEEENTLDTVARACGLKSTSRLIALLKEHKAKVS